MTRGDKFELASLIAIAIGIAAFAIYGRNDFESDHWPVQIVLTEPAAAGAPFDITIPPSALPDHKLTPGALYPNKTKEDILALNYSKSVRDVPESEKKEVFSMYGSPDDVGEYDHLIPLSIGGANTKENLWPQPANGVWNYKVKDNLEKRALKLIRDGDWDLKETQVEFAKNWIALYKKAFPNEPPTEALIAPEEQ